MKHEFDCLLEWAVWANLESKKEFDLILLNGHIALEQVLGLALFRKGVNGHEYLSFYVKVMALKDCFKAGGFLHFTRKKAYFHKRMPFGYRFFETQENVVKYFLIKFEPFHSCFKIPAG